MFNTAKKLSVLLSFLIIMSCGNAEDSINKGDSGSLATSVVGSYKSNISGDDVGTLYITINADDYISGMVTPVNSDVFYVSGKINGTGAFNLVSSKGFDFAGSINGDGNITGSWSDNIAGLNGSISGNKLVDDVVSAELSNLGYRLTKSCKRFDKKSGDLLYCRDSAGLTVNIYCPNATDYAASSQSCPNDDRIGYCPAGGYTRGESSGTVAFNEHYYIGSEYAVITDQNKSSFRFFDMGKSACRTAFQEQAPVNAAPIIRSCSRIDDSDGTLLFCRDKGNSGGNVTFNDDATVECVENSSTVAGSRACPLNDRVATCLAGTYINDQGALMIKLSNDNWYAASKEYYMSNGYSTFYSATIGSCSKVLIDYTRPSLPAADNSSFERNCPPYCDTMGSIYSTAAEAGLILPPPTILAW